MGKRKQNRRANEEDSQNKRSKSESNVATRTAASKLQDSKDVRLTRNRAKETQAELVPPSSDPSAIERSLREANKQKKKISKPVDHNVDEMENPNEGIDRNQRPESDDDLDEARQNTLQGLLRRLGAGMEDIFPHGHMPGSGRIKNILTMMRDEDEMQQLTGLTELCEYISISTEDTMVTFPTEQIVPLLVSMLGYEHNPDLMLLAARALTFLADIFPPASSSIVRHGAVPAFCARLLTIEYIDLAEQSLQALEKLSHDHRESLLRSGALVAVLSYIDFFQTGVQRVAVATAANIVRNVSIEHSEAIATAVPILLNLLQYADAKIVDSACLALTRITESYSKNATQMEMLCSFGLIGSIVEMVAVSEGGSISSQLSSSTFYGLIKLLATAASGSPLVAKELLGVGVSKTLRNLMHSSPLLSATAAAPGNALRSAEQLEDLVSLAAQILPAVPNVVLPNITGSGAAAAAATMAARDQNTCALRAHLSEHPEVAAQVASDLLPVLLKVYNSSGTVAVKRHSLAAVTKLLYYCPAEQLTSLLKDLPVSSWVSTLLNSRDSAVATRGMETAEVLMQKLPDVFSNYFLKEGVVHAMEQLAAQAPPEPEKDDEEVDVKPAETAAAAKPAQPTGGLMPLGVMTRRRSQSQIAASGSTPAPTDKTTGAAKEEEAEAPAGIVVARSPPPPLTQTQLTALAAKKFLAKYFTDADGKTKGCDTEGVRRLKALCNRLPDPSVVPELLTVMSATGEDAISTFELLSSGALKSLRHHLSGKDLITTTTAANNNNAEYHDALMERLSMFARCALPVGSGDAPPMLPLIRNLLAAFSQLDKFAIRLTVVSVPTYGGMYFHRGMGRSSTTGSGSLSSSLAALSNPLKIRLCKATDESSLKDHATQVVLIEPLASMAQVEDFLWPRVQNVATAPPAGAGGAGPSRAAGAGPSTAAAGAPGQPPAAPAAAAEQPTGRMTRSRGAAATATAATATTAQPSAAEPSTAAGTTAGGRPKASKNRPIPQAAGARRLTRAQARAAAEAEVANMGREAPPPQQDNTHTDHHQPINEAADAGMGGDPLSEDDADLLIDAPPSAERRLAEDEEGPPVEEADDDEMHDDEVYDDDDMDEGYVEGDANEFDEDEDEMMDAASMRIHDMHLAETEDPTASQQQAEEEAIAAATAAADAATAAAAAVAAAAAHRSAGRHHSYARAAAGGDAAGDGTRAGRAEEQPRLAFYINGKLIPTGSTVFQAIQSASRNRGSSTGSSGSEMGSRIWSEVHSLSYRSYESAMKLEEKEKTAKAGAAEKATQQQQQQQQGSDATTTATATAASTLESLEASPLRDLLPHTGALGDLEDVSDDLRDAVEVLRVLEALNRLGPRLVNRLEAEAGHVVSSDEPPLGRVPREAFAGGRLGPKLAQQLKDAVSICSGSLPAWCSVLTAEARFLFPFEVRRRYFYCTALGLPRALLYLQQMHAAEHPEASADRDTGGLRLGRVQRQKVRISRRRLLESAQKVFELYSGPKSMLEIEFFNEVGTGLGPTLEFYTLLSHELQRKSLGMWRHDPTATTSSQGTDSQKPSNPVADVKQQNVGPGPLKGELSLATTGHEGDKMREKDIVVAPQGLFPMPLPPTQRQTDSKVARTFRLLGRVVAKALQDQRLMDLPLSPVFYRLVLGRKVDMFDLRRIDPAMGASVERLYAAQQIAAASGNPNAPVIVDGATVEDLCLSFVLPGRNDYELQPGGADIAVTSANLKEYVEAVVDATLGSGITMQVEAFKSGFEEIFPLDTLKPFYVDEIEAMVCGTGESWTIDGLASVIKFDHGYTAQSPVIKALLEVLVELDPVDQRRFLRFVTGTPRLPPGGLSALAPRLTVVRKLSHTLSGQLSGIDAALAGSAPGGSLAASAGGGVDVGGSLPAGGLPRSAADGDLPSVMTCANYLKLPPYSTKEILKERLMFAVREGQGSFDLS